MRILAHPSPNHGPRRGGARPDLIVLHHTAMASAEDALARLCDPAAEVSAHYLITEQGDVLRLVDEARRAWHAGAGAWGRATDVNSRSIGVELASPGDRPHAAAQMDALGALLSEVRRRWATPPERVIGHACMAPGRKHDPGARFDWRRLALEGHAVWIAPSREAGGSADAAAFARAARLFGYPAPGDAVWSEALIAVADAFRLRFRPGEALGAPPGAAAQRQIEALATRWPVLAR